METLRERIISRLEERRQKILGGGVNCIPLPFRRFRNDLPGLEQGCYYLISGSTKSGKTQITNYIFIFSTVLYCYYNPDKVYPKVFYFPLEETSEFITLRFMSFLLNHLSKGMIHISPTDLKSTDERKPLSEDILEYMETEEFKNIMEVYESIVTFYDDRNPTGIWKTLKNYADNNGTTVYKDITMKDELGQEVVRKVFDYYIPNNPDEYIFIIVDHVSLLESERGLTLRETINKLSEYMTLLRNRYSHSPVIVQQQSTETQSLEAFKSNKIRPSVVGLSDSKYTARDSSLMIGITNPHFFELPEYMGYNIRKLKGNARFLEIVINRNGVSNGILPLYFDGATCTFAELPKPDNTAELEKVYRLIEKVKTSNVLMFTFNKNFINRFAGNKIKNYLCNLFHLKKEQKNGSNCSNFRVFRRWQDYIDYY